VEQYYELIECGILTPFNKVELLEGVLVRKMSKNPPHETTTGNITDVITPLIPKGWHLRTEATITLESSEPEPDGAVVRGGRDDYGKRHPASSDVALLIEISDRTLSSGRGVKLCAYARAGIVCYWIVNLIDRQIEVYTQPNATADVPAYAASAVFRPGDAVPFKIGQQLIAEIPVAEILPAV
jgi:Uma2 family endonuclease